uniref:PQQ-dependent sugar dehydrogenase n=1 Tax=Pararhizobium sp. IMCC3301 TaxID=3067904 RepID=UPI00274161F4|nr:PQQ-dependent sugar dehydrogenase [Pararhizobium sp. IMCC3301]
MRITRGFLGLFVLAGTLHISRPVEAASTTFFDKQVLERWTGSFATKAATVEVVPVVLGLEHPWGMSFLPDGTILVTERAGRLRLARNAELGPPIDGVPEVYNVGQGGLLDVALDPDFSDNRLIYLSFAEPGDAGAGTAVMRARLTQNGLTGQLDRQEVIFRENIKTTNNRQFGSRLTFAPDGTLFVTIGDRGEDDRAQDKRDHAGSVVRIWPDGSIPKDNPFLDDPDALPELWSIGHRNPQGAAIDPQTGRYWSVEHGARGGDELNRPEAGKNYGWPEISYGRHYSGLRIGQGTSAEGFEQPVYYWDPSIAPSGLAFYGQTGIDSWNSNAFVGALKDKLIARLEIDLSGPVAKVINEEQWDMSRWGRIRDIDVDADGNIWFLTDEKNGGLFKIRPDRP